MLSRLVAGVRGLIEAVTGLAMRLAGRWRRAWPADAERVATDPVYAAAAAAILAGMLGVLPPREVLVTVLATAINLLLRSRPDAGGSSEGSVDPDGAM